MRTFFYQALATAIHWYLFCLSKSHASEISSLQQLWLQPLQLKASPHSCTYRRIYTLSLGNSHTQIFILPQQQLCYIERSVPCNSCGCNPCSLPPVLIPIPSNGYAHQALATAIQWYLIPFPKSVCPVFRSVLACNGKKLCAENLNP